MESKEGVHDVSRGSDVQITSSVEHKQADLNLKNLISIEETLPQFNTAISGGLLSEPMSIMGANVTGIDASNKNIQVAKLHSKKNKLKINYLCSSPENLRVKKKLTN